MTTSRRNQSAMRMLGRQLAAARRAAGLSQSGLSAALNLNEETIASIEQGRRSLKPDIAELLDEYLGTKGTLAAGVANLPEVDQFPLWAEEYMDQEREAIALSWYDALVVPGLLQTKEYARGLLGGRIPAYDSDELETKAEARMQRREILHRKVPPTLSFVIWEPALRWPTGGPVIHREQLRFLRACSELPCPPCRFCLWSARTTPVTPALSHSWRRPTISTWPTPNPSAAANGSPTLTRCLSWPASMRCCGRRPSPSRTQDACWTGC